MVHKGAALDPALDRLEALCDGAAHLVGHNILRLDLPNLVANRARLAGLGAAPIDTLWLKPVAFQRNPYHHLVKHYHDGRLAITPRPRPPMANSCPPPFLGCSRWNT